MVTVFVSELVAIIWILVDPTSMESLGSVVTSHFKEILKTEYDQKGLDDSVIDFIQNNLECCGVYGPLDWKNSKYSNKTIIESSELDEFEVPPSCCRNKTASICDESRKIVTEKIDPNIFNNVRKYLKH
jgi:Tetraspanin family